MRRYTLYVLAVILVFGTWQAIYPQTETETAPLIKKWLKGEKIQSGPISLKTLKRQTEDDDFASLANITLLDLNHDGKKELAIQSECAAVENCGLEIYQKTGKAYKILLRADMVQVLKALKTTTNGFYDLELRTHGSAFESYHQIFKFDGKKYRRKRCWTESYQIIDKKGNLQELKKPKITYGCGEEY